MIAPATPEQLIKIAAEFCGIDSDKTDLETLSLSELGIDSLELVSLAIHLEETCHQRIDFENVNGSMTLRQLVATSKPVGN